LSGVFGQTATNAAYAAAAAARDAQAALISAQQSAFNAVFNVSPATAGNINLTVDFSGMANASTMTGVMLPGSTNLGYHVGCCGAANAVGGTDGVEVFPTQTTSDYQVITVTLGSLNDILYDPFGTIWTFIPGRMNSTRDTGVGAMIATLSGSLYIRLVKVVSGSFGSYLATSAALSLSSGGVIKIILGDPSSLSPYAMQVLYNGTPVITFTDSSHLSQVGASIQVCRTVGTLGRFR
jgi:hypothetical protein